MKKNKKGIITLEIEHNTFNDTYQIILVITNYNFH